MLKLLLLFYLLFFFDKTFCSYDWGSNKSDIWLKKSGGLAGEVECHFKTNPRFLIFSTTAKKPGYKYLVMLLFFYLVFSCINLFCIISYMSGSVDFFNGSPL